VLTRILEAIRARRFGTYGYSTFSKFPIWEGEPESGSNINFLGQRISTSFYASMKDSARRMTYPKANEEIFEWLALLEAVLKSGDTFTMIEAGAGYGRWLVSAACALRSLGRPTRMHFSRHHLEQRERPRMGQRRVQLGRHGDDAHADRSEIRRPLERIFERWPLDRRVPFDQDELGIEPVLAALCDEAVDEMLHPALQIATVVVIARPSKHLK
jgi:hypothetical protein